RRGAVELFASPAAALSAMVDAAGDRPPSVDREWAAGLRKRHLERVVKLRETMAHAPDGSDGRMHPNRLLAALQAKLPRDAIVVADGGDFLSFARVGLSSSAYLDPGPFGCIGVGVPFGIAASLAFRMHAERVERADDLPGAIDRAFARRPSLLDVVVTPEAVSADAKSGLAWVPDLQPLAAWDEAERAWRQGSS